MVGMRLQTGERREHRAGCDREAIRDRDGERDGAELARGGLRDNNDPLRRIRAERVEGLMHLPHPLRERIERGAARTERFRQFPFALLEPAERRAAVRLRAVRPVIERNGLWTMSGGHVRPVGSAYAPPR